MSALVPLDVCLNGARDYVQGTQLVARSAEAVAAMAPDAPLELRSAAFHRISDKMVSLREGTPIPPKAAPPDLLGTLSFVQAGTPRSFHLIEGTQEAPRGDLPPAGSWHAQDGPRETALSARFAVTGMTAGEDLLVAIVQTIKGLHEALADDVHDVWLTGFRSANIPMTGTFAPRDGMLSLQNRRVMKGDAVWQTLQMAHFGPAEAEPLMQAAVTFSFKSSELTHVD